MSGPLRTPAEAAAAAAREPAPMVRGPWLREQGTTDADKSVGVRRVMSAEAVIALLHDNGFEDLS